jgi:hypothetical protein
MGEATDRPDSPNVLAKWARASRENCSRDLEPVGLSVAKPHWMVDSLERVEASDAVLPLPAICLAALRLHHQAQAAVKDAAGPFWIPTGHVLPPRDGLPLDPHNFHRAFKARSAKAGVRCDPRPWDPPSLRVPAGRPGRPPPRRHADPETQQDRRDDGDLHPHPVRSHPDGPAPPRGPARSARVSNCCTLLLYFAPRHHKGPHPGSGEGL